MFKRKESIYNEKVSTFLRTTILFLLVLAVIPAQGKSRMILFLGDSLTEGYGIPKQHSYPMVVKSLLAQKGVDIEILNGSISGSTTASATSRLKWYLKGQPEVVFLALGANDGLRGIKINESKKNLAETIELAKKRGIIVVLAGMKVPPNYGPDYGREFENMYVELAKKYGIHHLPFLLEGVAGEKKYNQEDGIHPNRAGHEKMARQVAKFLHNILKRA